MSSFGLAILVIFGGVALFAHFSSHDVRVRRALRKAPLTTTASFDEGKLGKIQGTLRYLGEPLRSPLTGRVCACYEVIVEQNNGKTWRTVIHEYHARDFLLDDSSGTALVRIDGAKLSMTNDAHFRSGTWQDATPALEAFLARHGQSSTGLIFNRSLRYREGVLEAGEIVAVCGRGVREPDPDPRAAAGGYRDSAMRLTLSGTHEVPLYVSDDVSALS